jgi:hypothetical protein
VSDLLQTTLNFLALGGLYALIALRQFQHGRRYRGDYDGHKRSGK